MEGEEKDLWNYGTRMEKLESDEKEPAVNP
jgi:hypothetical protein